MQVTSIERFLVDVPLLTEGIRVVGGYQRVPDGPGLGAEYDCPPTLPGLLPVQRLGGSDVSLRWSESVKMGGGHIEYDVRVFADRECSDEIFRATTAQTTAPFAVPEPNRMYFVEVWAVDQHRERNPATWYPAGRWNFVLVPEDQYGWYGVM